MMTPDEKAESKRLKTEIEQLEAVPRGGAVVTVVIVAIVAGLTFPLTPLGAFLAFVVSVVAAFIVMTVLFFRVDDEVQRLKKQRTSVKNRRHQRYRRHSW